MHDAISQILTIIANNWWLMLFLIMCFIDRGARYAAILVLGLLVIINGAAPWWVIIIGLLCVSTVSVYFERSSNTEDNEISDLKHQIHRLESKIDELIQNK